jgi:hypothetical protein
MWIDCGSSLMFLFQAEESFASSTPFASVEDDPCNEEGSEAGKEGGADHECHQYWDCDRGRWRIGGIVRHLRPLEAAKLGGWILSLKNEGCEVIDLKKREVGLKVKEHQQKDWISLNKSGPRIIHQQRRA